MPRSGPLGTATQPSGLTPKNPGDIVPSAAWNTGFQDIYNIFNTPTPIAYGGTGASTAADARTALFGVSATVDNSLVRFDGTSGQLQGSTITVSDVGDVNISFTDNGATGGPSLQLDRVSASPAASDLLGLITFRGRDSGGAAETYAAILSQITDATSGSEDGRLLLQAVIAGTVSTIFTVQGGTSSLVGTLAATVNLSAANYSPTGATAGVLVVGDSGGAASVRSSTTSAASQLHAYYANPNGVVGSVTTNGTTTSFNNLSDERLKHNFRDFDSGAIIDGTAVYLYDWNAGGSGYGAKAQQAYTVFPQAVTPGNDLEPGDEGFMPWSMDMSKYVAPLLREVQLLRQRVAILESGNGEPA